MKKLLVILLLTTSKLYSQQVFFKTIKLVPQSSFYNTKDSTIEYPVLAIKNTAVNKLINDQIKAVIISEEFRKLSTSKGLSAMTKNGLTDMSFEVTFKKNGILSLNIYQQGCGAYCSSGTTYFNFDLGTGKAIQIEDVIATDKIDSFRNKVFTDKIAALNAYKQEQKESFSGNSIDSTEYYWSIEEVDNNCIKQVEINNFSLSSNTLELIDRCEFPHVIQSQQPTYELKYFYTVLLSFIKPEFKQRLTK